MLCAHQVLPFQIILNGYFYNDSNSDNPFKAEKVCVCHHSSAEQRLCPTLASFNHQLCNRVSLQSIYLTITIYTCLHWINLAVYTHQGSILTRDADASATMNSYTDGINTKHLMPLTISLYGILYWLY